VPLKMKGVQRQFRNYNSYMKIIPIKVIIDSGKVIIDSGLLRKNDRLETGISDHHAPDWVIGLHRNR